MLCLPEEYLLYPTSDMQESFRHYIRMNFPLGCYKALKTPLTQNG